MEHPKQHALFHEERNPDGTVPLNAILETMRERHPRPKLGQEEKLVEMFMLMHKEHSGDKRSQTNPVTGEPYPYTEHTTGTASVAANLGCPYPVVTAAAGHDLDDVRGKPSKDLKHLLDGFDPVIHGIIGSCHYSGNDKYWDRAETTAEEKENALMHRLRLLTMFPQGIVVGGADRFDNLFSAHVMKPQPKRRMLAETKNIYIPLLRSVDTVLMKAMDKKLKELMEDEPRIYHATHDHVSAAIRVLENYSVARARHGVMAPLAAFRQMKSELESGYDAFMKDYQITQLLSATLINGFMAEAKEIELPNLPSYDDIAATEQDEFLNIIAEAVSDAGKCGMDVNPDMDTGKINEMYRQSIWAEYIPRFLSQMVWDRKMTRLIQSYFEPMTTDILERPNISMDNLRLKEIGGIVTESREKVHYMRFEGDGCFYDSWNTIADSISMQEPMLLWETKEGLRVIAEPNNLVHRQVAGNIDGAVSAPIPYEPYTIIDMDGFYR